MVIVTHLCCQDNVPAAKFVLHPCFVTHSLPAAAWIAARCGAWLCYASSAGDFQPRIFRG